MKKSNIKIDAEHNPCDKLLWLAAMMVIDKNIHVNELKFIVDYGLKLGLEKRQIEQIVNMAKGQPDNLKLLLEKSALPKNEEFMRMLIRVVYADGKVVPEEIEFLKLAAKKMQYDGADLKILLEDEKEAFRNRQKNNE
ncbi:MAG: TerB family tellurite resistance protein [Candidatus Riflebacteria bacterium]|nr:TerB family tellurite resistance protein [Candidatus Riflebacteria bacterium]